MQSYNLITLVNTLACIIADTYSAEETALIAAIFTQLGDTITTILANNEICNKLTS